MAIRAVIAVQIVALFAVGGLSAQPTGDVFGRVLLLEGKLRGTGFVINVESREYWITAKHVITGAQRPPWGSFSAGAKETLRVAHPGTHTLISVTFAVIDPGTEHDIAVLVPPSAMLPRSSLGIVQEVGLGQDCYYLGFPFGSGFLAEFEKKGRFLVPYVKKCALSAVQYDRASNVTLWVLDGLSNKGFSGGPVMFRGKDGKYGVAAVLHGYKPEPTEVKEDGRDQTKPPSTVDLNSGFILAHGIQSAIDAIRRTPIGPEL